MTLSYTHIYHSTYMWTLIRFTNYRITTGKQTSACPLWFTRLCLLFSLFTPTVPTVKIRSLNNYMYKNKSYKIIHLEKWLLSDYLKKKLNVKNNTCRIKNWRWSALHKYFDIILFNTNVRRKDSILVTVQHVWWRRFMVN